MRVEADVCLSFSCQAHGSFPGCGMGQKGRSCQLLEVSLRTRVRDLEVAYAVIRI